MLGTKMLKLGLVWGALTGTFVFAQADTEPVKMEFYNDLATGVPFQDVYIETTGGMVKRVELDDPISTLFQPLYGIPFNNPPDIFEPPFDIGPYEQGAPLGFTLTDWLAARGTGTYTVSGDRARLDLEFKNLVPDGVYTLWCSPINLPNQQIGEAPCGAPDGSENTFMANKEGTITVSLEMDAFPESTEDTIHEVALAYHSDGQTYGARAGEFGHNVHVQLVYDFVAPAND